MTDELWKRVSGQKLLVITLWYFVSWAAVCSEVAVAASRRRVYWGRLKVLLLLDLSEQHKHGYSGACGGLSEPLQSCPCQAETVTKHIKLKDVGQTLEHHWGGGSREKRKRRRRGGEWGCSQCFHVLPVLFLQKGLLGQMCCLRFFMEFWIGCSDGNSCNQIILTCSYSNNAGRWCLCP